MIQNTLVVMQMSRRNDIPLHIRHTFRMDTPEHAGQFHVVREGETMETEGITQVLVLADDTQITSDYITSVIEQLKYYLPDVPMVVLPVEDAPMSQDSVDIMGLRKSAMQYWGQP